MVVAYAMDIYCATWIGNVIIVLHINHGRRHNFQSVWGGLGVMCAKMFTLLYLEPWKFAAIVSQFWCIFGYATVITLCFGPSPMILEPENLGGGGEGDTVDGGLDHIIANCKL